MNPHDLFKLWSSSPSMVVVDTETSGLTIQSGIIEITIMEGSKTVLFNQRINPLHPIPAEATQIHGITDTDVAGCPTWKDLLPQISEVLAGRKVVFWNEEFDTRMMFQSSHQNGVVWPGIKGMGATSHCAMKEYAKLMTLPGQKEAKFFKLLKACQLEKLDPSLYGAAHSSIGDCQRVVDVIHAVAARWEG
ncbi:3'-5' exonuclease [Deinococcus misasensis]|uniref:3'-5' exonuclease n=1 Tax=Deinococcus misasensis TaxID=392413 RepID=UPI0005511413|nr:3'-5' exonuclease [Deinococcus misasensis]